MSSLDKTKQNPHFFEIYDSKCSNKKVSSLQYSYGKPRTLTAMLYGFIGATVEEAKELKEKAIEIFEDAIFTLHKWKSNEP